MVVPIPRFTTDHLDRSVDPAKDFYRFACGAWVRSHPIPSDKSRWGGFDELLERNYALLRTLLEDCASADAGKSSEIEQKVGDFFASSIDQERRDRVGFRPILGDLAAIERLGNPREIVPHLAGLHRVGVQAGFRMGVYPDRKRSSVYALYLNQGGLSLPDRDYYLADTYAGIRTKYRAHLVRMLQLAGSTTAKARKQAAIILDLETALARASRPRADLRDPVANYHPYPIEDLAAKFAHLQWPRYLSRLHLPPLDGVIVGQPEFFEALDRIIPERPLSDWRAYLRWHYLLQSAPYLHSPVVDENFAFFSKELLGTPKLEPPWRLAAKNVDRTLGEALGELYVRRYFPPEAKARMDELVRDLCAVFRDRLSQLAWMTPETRARALEKFARFTPKIGHPEKYRDYSRVRVRRTDFFGNMERASAFEIRRRLDRAGGKVDRTEWMMTPPTVNAYFDPSQNEIVFPAGILQPPFFDITMDDAVNLGGIGAVIGHEVTHGFDDQGRKFDGEGNLRDWWTERDTKEFQARAERIKAQYSAFEALPKTFVNGNLTQGENIADLGGREHRVRGPRAPAPRWADPRQEDGGVHPPAALLPLLRPDLARKRA